MNFAFKQSGFIPDSVQHKMTTSKNTKEYFSQISNDKLQKLYFNYENDFELFGYDIKEFLDIPKKVRNGKEKL